MHVDRRLCENWNESVESIALPMCIGNAMFLMFGCAGCVDMPMERRPIDDAHVPCEFFLSMSNRSFTQTFLNALRNCRVFSSVRRVTTESRRFQISPVWVMHIYPGASDRFISDADSPPPPVRSSPFQFKMFRSGGIGSGATSYFAPRFACQMRNGVQGSHA